MINLPVTTTKRARHEATVKAAVSLAAGFAAGAVVGAALGLLFAPKPGAETRKDERDRRNREDQVHGDFRDREIEDLEA